MLFLFRITTGENWNAVMWDCMNLQNCILITGYFVLDGSKISGGAPGSDYTVWPGTYLDADVNADILAQIPSSGQINQCSPSPAIVAIYFESYMLLVTYLLLQLVIGIIIENIEQYSAIEDMPISQVHMQVRCL